MGERTFGEGAVLKSIDLPDGAALMLTVAKYEGPDGKKIGSAHDSVVKLQE
ncbi:MAG: S41 family peptidase [Candidatus Acidiferrales bacterium]